MSSKRAIRRKACDGKRRYEKQEAISRAQSLRRRGHFINAYSCSRCGSWHLGHPDKAARRAIRQRAKMGSWNE
jgi:spore germination protein YaaH